MKIIITGGCGFIGSNLVRYLLTHTDHHVLNLDKLTYAGNLNSLKEFDSHDRYQFKPIDICDLKTLGETIREFAPKAIMHLAAESHVDRSIDGPDQFIQTNVIGTFNLLQATRQYLTESKCDQFRFLHVSTDEVFGSLGVTGKFQEASPYQPHSPYSASKASSDHLVRAWGDTYKLPILVTNCSNNYGPYQFPEKLIPVVILKAIHGEKIPVYGKGENIRDWLYVEDHVTALYEVLMKGNLHETYLIGGNNEMRNIDLVHLICQVIDELKPRTDGKSYRSQIEFVTDRPGHDLRYAVDASKIHTELKCKPQQDHQSGFRKTIQWYLDNKEWWSGILDGSYRLERVGLKDK